MKNKTDIGTKNKTDIVYLKNRIKEQEQTIQNLLDHFNIYQCERCCKIFEEEDLNDDQTCKDCENNSKYYELVDALGI